VPSTPHLKSLQAVELAVRLGSLQRAAAVLSISPAAVGQRIKTLEDYLGIELLVRGRAGLRPLPELQQALPHLERAFRELDRAAELLDLQRGNEIHIAANQDFVELWLQPRLPAFRQRLPNVRFCINGVGDAPMRLGRVDCEISFGADAGQAPAESLFHDYLLPIASAENARRVRGLRRKYKLEGFPLLHLDFYKEDPAAIDWQRWIHTHGHRRTAPDRGIRFQRIAPALEAVHSDAGLLICGAAMIAGELSAGRLVAPFAAATGAWTGHAFHARFRGAGGPRTHLRQFRGWLLDEAGQTRAWLESFAGGAPTTAGGGSGSYA